MRISQSLARAWRWIFALAVLVVPANAAFAQHTDVPFRVPAGGLLAMSGLLMFCFIMALVMYVYFALALQTIATKTNTENPWLAWIPVVNLILVLNIAKKPIWWFVLFLIPLVNIVVSVITWMAVAEARNKPSWWGIVLLVPAVGIIVPGYLAWSD
jgi:Family of unknown function (DUF5684)